MPKSANYGIELVWYNFIMIRKVKEGYRVVAESGRNMGTYPTREQAEKRLRQIEMFKHMGKRSIKYKV